MGWDIFESGDKPIDIGRRLAGDKVIADNYADGAYYAAVPFTHDGRDGVLAVVILIERAGREVRTKFMDETMGPCYYKPSREVLAALTDHGIGYSRKWRAECRAQSRGKYSQKVGRAVRPDAFAHLFT